MHRTPSSAFSAPPPASALRRLRPFLWAGLSGLFMLAGLFTSSGHVDLLAQNLFEHVQGPLALLVETAPSEEAPERERRARDFTFRNHPLHPDVRHWPHFGTRTPSTELALPSALRAEPFLPAFRDLLDRYVVRQGLDDNFSIRVIDGRSDEVLEIFSLRARPEWLTEEGAYDWQRVDHARREETRRLVKKYERRGVPRGRIIVKWGRADQVREARRREAAFIAYEIRLAELLGLSLLATEIGTVETFNNDRLISRVGARGRYQMMPYLLRQNGIHHYQLRTATGTSVRVYEEWHPLLTMEAAFLTMKGYVNAVGHEIPGISAYHTGPGNIFKLYRMFLGTHPGQFTTNTTVLDAYLWAVTDGYDQVSENTSFRSYSRSYVSSAYGSLRATESLPVDTMQTLETERVQLKPGHSLYVSQLLEALETGDAPLDWSTISKASSPYERFRRLNPHFDLPPASDQNVPLTGDVRLVHQAGSAPVRFFLPLGATEHLADAGVEALDETATFRFDRSTYRPPRHAQTIWDLQYDDLVQRIARFGFTPAHRDKLNMLAERFAQLAEEDPSHYRQMQLQLIQTHARIWSFGVWSQLSEAVLSAQGNLRLSPQPPLPLDVLRPAVPTQPVDGR